MKTVRMLNPPHPLDVSRHTRSAIVNGRAGIGPEMAVRQSIAFDTTAESWLQQQMQCDLWHAEQSRKRLRDTCNAASTFATDTARSWFGTA